MPDYRLLLLGAGILTVLGCAVSTKDTIIIAEPISTVESAIESMTGTEKATMEVDADGLPRYVAILPFVNNTEEPEAPEIIRRTLQNHITTKNYQVMHWREFDLRAADWAATGSAQALSAEHLGVGGVVRGTINSYEFLHAGVYAHIKLGVDLQLENAAGEVLWSDSVEVTTRAGGISTTPWGLLLNAAIATMHLSEENLMAAADELGREVSAKFPEPAGYQGMSGPTIENVLHDGADKTLTYGDVITLGLKGDPGQQAVATIEGVGNFDLTEGEPGVYLIKQPVSAEWNIDGKQVSGRLTNASGQSTRWVSPVGLVSIDNLAPSAVAGLKLGAHSGNAYLSWASTTESDVSAYRIYQLTEGKREQVQQIDGTSVTLSGQPQFGELRYEVTVLDRVGNESPGVVATARAYPMPGAAEAEVASSRLGGVVTGALLMSASKSPYTLTSNLIVEAGGELFVEPGVVVRAARDASVHIKGSAWFWGEQAAIKFEPQQKGVPVKQYLVLDSTETVSLHGVVFELAGIAIGIKAGSAELRAVQFNDSQFSAMNISGSASPTITGCTVKGSNTSGVVIENHAKPAFHGCTFINNQPFHIQSTSIYEVDAESNSWDPAASASTVLGQVRY